MLEPRDKQAQLLYQCEFMTPYQRQSPRFRTMEDARNRLYDIQSSRVWAEKIRIAGYVHLSFDLSDTLAGLFTWLPSRHPEITLYQHGMTDSTLLHELAHYIHSWRHGYKYPHHGWRYARIYLGLLHNFVNEQAARDLMGWFDHAGVKYGKAR